MLHFHRTFKKSEVASIGARAPLLDRLLLRLAAMFRVFWGALTPVPESDKWCPESQREAFATRLKERSVSLSFRESKVVCTLAQPNR